MVCRRTRRRTMMVAGGMAYAGRLDRNGFPDRFHWGIAIAVADGTHRV